jgi:uncharacterized protein (TIGR03000 family)
MVMMEAIQDAMKLILFLVSAVLPFQTQGAAAVSAHGPLFLQAAKPAAAQVTSRITVTVPQDEAELSVEGNVISGKGATRAFETSRLEAGRTYRYTFAATWQPNSYTTMTRTKVVSFRGGERLTVDLSVDDPTDRVQVRYVPTPDEVVDGMIKLAGVSATDVVYEPGCGDARITIAAVKSGARKGVGIDIDAERVADSRTKVREAGLADRIDIRQGDALDIPDLSQATVVFLYMGDHFDMLIRPRLWKDLPVGARVVSHRFTMGDWKPDRTVTMQGPDGLEYQLHLWVITEELKRRGGVK